MKAGPRIAVVGGGISGLAAAHRLRMLAGPGCRIELFEESGRIGGKLMTMSVGGTAMELGAEAFLARRPEVPALLAELGLGDEVEHPSPRTPRLRAGGGLHPVPGGTLMGIPGDPGALPGVLGTEEAARAAELDGAPMRWVPGADVSVGELVSSRYGEPVVRRCVDPLLGGVYSGSAASAGVRAVLPPLAQALDNGAPSLREAVRMARPDPKPGPVFGALRGGYGRLTGALAQELSAPSGGIPARIHTGMRVERVRPAGAGWELTVRPSTAGPRGEPRGVATDEPRGAATDEPSGAATDGPGGAAAGRRPVQSGTGVGQGYFDAVILAVPAPGAAGLLRDAVPAAADAAGRIRLADSAVVAVALPADVEVPEFSGVLVATDEERVGAKACTISSRKWPHLEPSQTGGPMLLRLSYGKYGAAEVVGESDAALTDRAREDMRELLGVDAEPVAVRVQRWRGGLPQYGVGHGQVVAEFEAALADVPGIAAAGSAWHGVGVPACVAGGRAAAESVLAGI